MKFEKTRVYNFDNALRGMRNPKNSWEKSDSQFYTLPDEYVDIELEDIAYKEMIDVGIDPDDDWVREEFADNFYSRTQWYWPDLADCHEVIYIGPNDMKLARQLIEGGSEHRKFLRQIFVTVDITAPQYWWSEFDTYKIGTTANSTSKMHKLASTPITLECFEPDLIHFIPYDEQAQRKDLKHPIDEDFLQMCLIPYLEFLRNRYNETKDIRYWEELLSLLSQSWLQTRTVTMNYENLRSMVHQREHHKQSGWRVKFIDWVKTLPYANEFIFN